MSLVHTAWPGSPKGGIWMPDAVIASIVALRMRTSSDFRVLLVVACTQARYGGTGGYSGLSLQRMAEVTGLSRSTIKRSIARLIGGGILVRKRKGRPALVCTLFEQDELPRPVSSPAERNGDALAAAATSGSAEDQVQDGRAENVPWTAPREEVRSAGCGAAP